MSINLKTHSVLIFCLLLHVCERVAAAVEDQASSGATCALWEMRGYHERLSGGGGVSNGGLSNDLIFDFVHDW